MKEMGSTHFEAFSAGVTPKGEVSPVTLKVLQDRFQIDASGARSKSWDTRTLYSANLSRSRSMDREHAELFE